MKENYGLKYRVWKCIDIAISITPLLIYAIINFNKYFGTKKTSFSNVLGFGTLIIVLVIVLSKKTQILNGLKGLILFELILIFLDVYIKDLKFILGMGLVGLILATFISHPMVEKFKRLRDKQETAMENATAMNQGVSQIVDAIVKGSGRV